MVLLVVLQDSEGEDLAWREKSDNLVAANGDLREKPASMTEPVSLLLTCTGPL